MINTPDRVPIQFCSCLLAIFVGIATGYFWFFPWTNFSFQGYLPILSYLVHLIAWFCVFSTDLPIWVCLFRRFSCTLFLTVSHVRAFGNFKLSDICYGFSTNKILEIQHANFLKQTFWSLKMGRKRFFGHFFQVMHSHGTVIVLVVCQSWQWKQCNRDYFILWSSVVEKDVYFY